MVILEKIKIENGVSPSKFIKYQLRDSIRKDLNINKDCFIGKYSKI